MHHGASEEKVAAALGDYRNSDFFSPREKLALELCERMTYTDRRVTDGFFDDLKRHFSEEELVELAAIIALENFRSKFNPVFAVESQNFCPLPAVKAVAAEAARRLHEEQPKFIPS
jgi:alkylhydroperoxidase family enzyme